MAAVLGCVSPTEPMGSRLTIIAGGPVPEQIPPDCELAEWTAPWGKVERTCLDRSIAFDITRADLYGLRLEDRRYCDETWYLVSILLGEIKGRIWHALEAPPLAPTDIPPGAIYLDYLRQLPPRDKLYAVFLDQQLLVVSQGMGIEIFPSLIAATQDRSRAEAIAYGFGVPVERWISEELDAQPVNEISLVQLIASPHYWIGKRVSVQGHLAPLHTLYLTRDHARALDYRSSVELQPRILDEADFEALSACNDKWVSVQGFVDSDRGMIELVRLESVSSRDGANCWPPSSKRPEPASRAPTISRPA